MISNFYELQAYLSTLPKDYVDIKILGLTRGTIKGKEGEGFGLREKMSEI